MVFPVAGRNERFDGLAEKLVSRVAEHALGLGIYHDDPTGSLHHDHRAGRRLDDQPEPLFGGKRRLRLMAPIHPFAAIDCVVVRAVAGVAVAIGVVLSVSTTHSHLAAISTIASRHELIETRCTAGMACLPLGAWPNQANPG